MNLVRWRPYGDLLSLRNRFNQIFADDFFRDDEEHSISATSWHPAADIFETKEEYVFKVELPGLSKDDISIEFENGILTIKGEKTAEKDVKEENFHRFERSFGIFCRSFTLPKNIDDKKIKANMKDGILELKVPKAEEAKAKNINININ